ncbi:MAG: cysteine dioxygenase family protein [Phycisphaerales bacterium]
MTSLSTNATTRCPGEYPKLGALMAYLDGLSRRADLDVLASLLSRLDVGRCDIAPACIFGQKGYRRNTIRATEWYELLALCWHSGDRTPIHDHRGVSCAFRVVEGTGTEIRFRNTASGLICPTVSVEMPPGYICAANDSDIHEVANMQAPGTDLITLHIYSPPIRQMTTYDFAAPVPEECRSSYVKTAEAGEIPC